MNNLLIDIGNSDVKIGVGRPGISEIKFTGRFSYSKKDFNKDFTFNFFNLNSAKDFGNIGISTLIDSNSNYLNKFFKNEFKLKPIFVNREINLPVRIDYSKGLGNDRICNAAAAVKIFRRKNILIIDFGTATTYTMVSDKVISGGMISPGIRTSLVSLTAKTSLPEVKLNFPKSQFCKNTIDNIKAGVLYQSLYTAERIILESKKKYGDLLVVATGGYAKLISGRTKLINKVDQHLVLKGINYIIS